MIPAEGLEDAISHERFGRYLAWAGGDRDRALELYALNIRVSEALYPPLQMLEVVLRNRIHSVLSETRGPFWFTDDAFITGEQQAARVQEALTNLARDGKAPTPSGVIAALTFSFWTAVLGPAHETLWQTDLHRIGRREDGKGLQRKAFSGPLTPIRILRNRVAHHEPILAWNLPQHYAAMVRIIGWLSLSAAIWCDGLNRFAAVYPPQRLMLYQD